MNSTNKVAVVTGASRGIGAATATRLAADGFAVCVNYLQDSSSANHVARLVNDAGGSAIAVQADVSLEKNVEELFQDTCSKLGRPTALVNNAGRLMSTELGGSGGAIVNVSSAAARLGSAGEYIDYAASKGAIDTLTVGLANEVADQGIRVNAVRPGFIYTDMHASGGEPDRVNRLKSGLPMNRGGLAEEVAAAISWLTSDESTFIDVSGGR